MSFTAQQAAHWCRGRLQGDPDRTFSGMDSVDRAGSTHLTFVGNASYAAKLPGCAAAGALCANGLAVEPRADQTLIWVDNADIAVAMVLENIAPPAAYPPPGIHASAVIDSSATLGANLRIGPHVVIEHGAVIGDGCVFMAGAYVGVDSILGAHCVLWQHAIVRERCVLGKRVVLHASCVVGADGFGYRFLEGNHVKIPQIGTVEIGDDCELGANTTIDRGKFSATRLGKGCKLDNLIQIGHNVVLGNHAILAAQAGIAGSVTAGDYLMMGGAAVIRDHVTLGNQVQVAATSGVAEDAPNGAKLVGLPAKPAREFFAELRSQKRAGQALTRVERLEERVAKIESAPKNDCP